MAFGLFLVELDDDFLFLQAVGSDIRHSVDAFQALEDLALDKVVGVREAGIDGEADHAHGNS